ncbi:MAG: hypothetical protein R2861_13520 [Desulfobacterales bacterium]
MPAVFLFLILCGVTAGNCFAHRVVIFAWMEGDTVYTESQFPDGRKIADATVKVFDPQKKLLLTGKPMRLVNFRLKFLKFRHQRISPLCWKPAWAIRVRGTCPGKKSIPH